jgi:CBS domain-containing protein
MDFEAAHNNFIAAARQGIDAQLQWIDGSTVPVARLLTRDLIPLARAGLLTAGIASDEADRYLDVVAERVASRRTGSRWALDSLAAMGAEPRRGTSGERLAALTRAMVARQKDGGPVHAWPLACLSEAGNTMSHYAEIGQIMTTELFTVRPDDPVTLVAHLMDWRGIRHVPVEDAESRLVGMVSYRAIVRLVGQGAAQGSAPRAVSEIMHADPVSAAPDTPTVEAIETMVKHGVSCLPIVRDGRLVGIVSDRDFMALARELFLEGLRDLKPPAKRRPKTSPRLASP